MAELASTSQSTDPTPTYFFDMENCRHLPPELFTNYMKVLQVLSFDRLGEDFTGDCLQMRRLMSEITVFDIFCVVEALKKSPNVITECQFKPDTWPSTFAEWQHRIAMPSLEKTTRRMSIDSDEPTPKRKMLENPAQAGPSGLNQKEGANPSYAKACKSGAEAAAKSASKKKPSGKTEATATKQPAPGKTKKPKPGLKPKERTDAAKVEKTEPTHRPVSPVSCGFRSVYDGMSRKSVARLEFLRRIPVLSEPKLAEVTGKAVGGTAYRTRSLREAAVVSAEAPPDWKAAFESLSHVYRPDTVVLVDVVSKHDYDVTDCLKWKCLPFTIVTTDKEFWKSTVARRKIERDSTNWADDVPVSAE